MTAPLGLELPGAAAVQRSHRCPTGLPRSDAWRRAEATRRPLPPPASVAEGKQLRCGKPGVSPAHFPRSVWECTVMLCRDALYCGLVTVQHT